MSSIYFSGNAARYRLKKILKNIPHVVSANVDTVEGLKNNKDLFNSKPGKRLMFSLIWISSMHVMSLISILYTFMMWQTYTYW